MSTATTEKKETVALTIDGRKMAVKNGTTILEAARTHGINIPTLCYVKKLNPIGSCRVCSVEIDGIDGPVMSCVTPATEGMNITTQSDALVEFRRNMIQFILVNHPLDCPVCERSGECYLQNRTYEFNIHKHMWKTNEDNKVPVVNWNFLRYDQNLCIMCERCVKICIEVQGLGALEIADAGYASRIKPVEGETLDCDFCGQCWSVCPVGAISSAVTFPARSWEVEKTKTVCPHCGVGCSIHLNVKKGEIARVTSSDGMGNNHGNLCSRGRFGYQFQGQGDRISAPIVHEGKERVATDWDTALVVVARKLDRYRKTFGKDAIIGIGSERATNEDNYVFQKFFRTVLESGTVENLSNLLGPEAASGVHDNIGGIPTTCSFDDMRKGNLFVYIGAQGSTENPVVANQIREAVLARNAEVAIAFSKEPEYLPPPKLQLTYDYTAMNDFMVALLRETVEGGATGAVAPSDDWKAKLAQTSGNVSDALKKNIASLAALTREKGNPVYLVGLEAQRHPQAKAILRNIANLAKLTGGKVVVLREYANTKGVNDMGVCANTLPGYEKETRAAFKTDTDIVRMMESGTVKALVVMDEDILRRYPDRARLEKAMGNLESIVVIDHFNTETTAKAGIILPSATPAEKNGSYTNMEGRIQKLQKALEPYGQALSPWEIMTRLAEKMGHVFDYETVGDVTAEIMRDVPGYKEMQEHSGLLPERADGATALTWADVPPVKKPGNGTLLALGNQSLFALGLYTDLCSALKRHYEKAEVELNPADAESLGLADGDEISVQGGASSWSGTARVTDRVGQGTVWIPSHRDINASFKLVGKGRERDAINVTELKG